MELIDRILVAKEAHIVRHSITPTVVLVSLANFNELKAKGFETSIHNLWIVLKPKVDMEVV